MKEIINKAKDTVSEVKNRESLGHMLKELFENLRTGKGKETLASVTAIIITLFAGKLAGLKNDVEKNRNKKKDNNKKTKKRKESATQKPDKDEPATEKTETPAPAKQPVAVQPERLRQGELFASLQESFPFAEIEPKLIPLKTSVSKPRPGEPNWNLDNSAGTTHEWNWKEAGKQTNLDENQIRENARNGLYCIEGVQRVAPFDGRENRSISPETAQKLTSIAVALRADARMPLFTGIRLKVDGTEVLLFKEIHMHPPGSASAYLRQPHTGVSYAVKSV